MMIIGRRIEYWISKECYQYIKNEQSPLIGLRQAYRYGGVKRVNGILTIPLDKGISNCNTYITNDRQNLHILAYTQKDHFISQTWMTTYAWTVQ
jgi:hypothetical protein